MQQPAWMKRRPAVWDTETGLSFFPLQLDCLKPLREQIDVLLQPELVRTDGKAAGLLLTQRPAQVSTVTQIVLIV